MQLSVRLFAALRERAGTDELRLDGLPDGATVADLKRELLARFPELRSLDHVRAAVGNAYVDEASTLREGDEVALIPPVSGGSGEGLEAGVFEISAEPLDVGAAMARVGHASCGAICTFTGTTRDRNRAKDVEHLDYEAFHEMAGAEMARIFAECAERFGPASGRADGDGRERALRMLCLHRTGRVDVGEPSVVIAVASPHRDAAFAAARFLIDELKKRVPLWKKEHYRDGHDWIGDRS